MGSIYYTDFEPESAWVAAAGMDVIGFLTGCRDTRRQQRLLRGRLIPDLLWSVVRGRYRLGPKTWQYAGRLALGILRDELLHVDLEAYPAHLHVNVAREWRGIGMGKQLLTASLDQFRHAGIPGVHLETSSQNVAACKLYQRLGFRLVDTRITRLWNGLVAQEVENRAYAMKLS